MKKLASELTKNAIPFTNNWLKLHDYAIVRNGGVWGYKIKRIKGRRKEVLPFM